ncbi:GON domain-containing protein [Corallococcus sp. bb12-1]|uniref:GON domain-containing protein n=1 Tax=Corallococcus sp. bb12-1 TaxID=2996784 RepID=UPI0022710913|nr:GON domain-containing protein [Corallococcus sp. bb12-1]MCY1042359.1 GON domain-containing protein [Corallococcus sp. bb12-1]
MNTPKPAAVSLVVPSTFRWRGWPALALSLAAFATGCGTGEESNLAVRAKALETRPRSCQDIKNGWLEAPDGDYTLYVSGDASAPWTVYCHGMAGTPTEFLTLARTEAGANSSRYNAGGASPGTTVRTAFTRLRIHPLTLKVNTADQTFATSTGSLRHSPDTVTSMSYGVAMSCNRTLAQANIDLRDTPFAVPRGQLVPWAGGTAGSGAVYSEQDQVVSLLGGGYCGFVGIAGIVNPYNQNGGLLQLQYRLGDRPMSCQDIKTAQPAAQDGDYTLFVNRDPLKPWTAYCHGMAGTPAEYLTLVRTGDGFNSSQYTAGGNSPGGDVRTTYARIRINPLTLRTDTADQTFATSTGSLLHGNQQPVNAMPYASAMGCSTVGLANIDLRGTPFALISGQLSRGGVSSESSSVSFSDNNQVANLRGYGGCGWVAPVGSFNPFNQNGVSLLLAYATPQ